MLPGFAGHELLGVPGAHPPAEEGLLPGTGVLQDYLKCDGFILPTTKGVAHIGACSVELSEEPS